LSSLDPGRASQRPASFSYLCDHDFRAGNKDASENRRAVAPRAPVPFCIAMIERRRSARAGASAVAVPQLFQ
jgi:hypothetical protein